MTIYLIDGKPHKLCDCDEHSELCPRQPEARPAEDEAVSKTK